MNQPPPGGGYPPGYGNAPPQGYGAPPAGYGAPQAPYGGAAPAPYGAPPGQAPYGAPPGQAPYGPPPGAAPYGGGNPYAPPTAMPGPGYAPMPGAMPGAMRQQHPRAMTALILGAVSWFLGLWLICSVPAWIMGASALKEIRANPQLYTGENEARIGMWLGIVHTALGALVMVGILIFVLIAVVAG